MDASRGVGDAEICRWLSSLLARELTVDAMDAYRAGAASPYWDALAARVEIDPARTTFFDAVAGWDRQNTPQRALAADFAELFLMPGPGSAPPYASAYSGTGQLMGQADERLTKLMQHHGIAVNMDANEPADHVAVMLEFLARLHTVDPSGEEAEEFRVDELAPWIGDFADAIERNQKVDGFYRAAAGILKSYVGRKGLQLS